MKFDKSKKPLDPYPSHVLTLVPNTRRLSTREDITHALVFEAQQGNEKARHALIEHNIGLINMVANAFADSLETRRAMIGEGYFGMNTAIDRFNADRGVKFSTYAVGGIIIAILNYIGRNSGTIRIPVNAVWEKNTIGRAATAFYQSNGRLPTYDELSDVTGFSVEKICDRELRCQDVLSLDARPNEQHGDERTLFDMTAMTLYKEIDDQIYHRSLPTDVQELLGRFLSEREALIVYFYDYVGGYSYGQLGKIIHRTYETVRLIRQRALRKLRGVPEVRAYFSHKTGDEEFT